MRNGDHDFCESWCAELGMMGKATWVTWYCEDLHHIKSTNWCNGRYLDIVGGSTSRERLKGPASVNGRFLLGYTCISYRTRR